MLTWPSHLLRSEWPCVTPLVDGIPVQTIEGIVVEIGLQVLSLMFAGDFQKVLHHSLPRSGKPMRFASSKQLGSSFGGMSAAPWTVSGLIFGRSG